MELINSNVNFNIIFKQDNIFIYKNNKNDSDSDRDNSSDSSNNNDGVNKDYNVKITYIQYEPSTLVNYKITTLYISLGL